MPIAVVGTTFVDVKGFPFDNYIPAGRNAGNVEFVHGGVGRNVAEDIANLELRPIYVSMVDESAQGTDVIEKLKNHKVNTDYIMRTKNGMGIWLAVFDETGDVAGAISKRPEMGPLASLIDEKGDEIFASCDSIVLEMDLDKEIVKSVFKFAEKYRKKVYAVVANMSIASERRDFIKKTDCFICNEQEAGILFLDDFESKDVEKLPSLLYEKITAAEIPSMVVTLGSKGAVYASKNGETGLCPANKVCVRDTTGAGDAFCAGVSAGLTYGKNLKEAVEIGTRLASAVITVDENVCPRYMPQEFGLNVNYNKEMPSFYGEDDILK